MSTLKLKKTNYKNAKEFAILHHDSMVLVCLSKTPSFRDLLLFVSKDDVVIGLVILYDRYCPIDGLELQHVFLVEKFRGNGYYKEIIELLARLLKKLFLKYLYVRTIISSTDEANSHTEFYSKIGFEVYDTSTIYTCNVDDKNYKFWNETKDRFLNKLVNWHIKNGIKTVSFSDANYQIINTLKRQKDYSSQYSIKKIITGVSGKLVGNSSFISILNNKPVAVSIVLEATPTQAIFQLISEDNNYKGTGLYLPAIYASMESLLKSNYKTVSFCIFEYNKHMEKDMKILFSSLVNKTTIQKSLKRAIR